MKKVLIINSSSIKENNSTSITLRSILNFFNNDELLEVHYFPIKNINNNCDIKSLKLKSKTKIIYNIISKLYKGKIKNDINTRIVENEIQNKINFLKKIKKIIMAFDDYIKPNIKCNKKILNEVKDYNPDVIYTLGSSIFSLKMANFFSELFNIPIVLHHMDNWRETLYNDSKLLECPRKRLVEELKKVESNMNFGMTISENMANHYESISQKKYFALMHTVESFNISVKNKNNDSVNIVYAGGLHLERWRSLIKIEEALLELKPTNKNINFFIFTKEKDREKYENEFNDKIVTFKDYLSHHNVYKIYELADILIHVESFNQKKINFTKYSLSTKIPEYMASGCPIICFAPEIIASYKYISDSRAGISVSDYEELSLSLKKLISDDELRKKLGNNGIETARQKHSKSYKNKILRKVFEIEE